MSEPTEKTAQLVTDNLSGFNGHAAVYKMTPPHENDYESDAEPSEYVVISAVNNGWAHETYIFASNAAGDISSFSERTGSMRGTTSHTNALENAGYKLQ